ncbi:MAG: TonB C-terminal domain-containing protein [Rhizobiaceae bacterium]|nr:TonB C-terminal domain-containing protein [Rhizobiaceae bacterium]
MHGPLIVAATGLGILGLSAFACAAQDASCRQSTPVNTLEAMWSALGRCWQPPEGTQGLEVTVRFSLRRDGSLNGKPQITWLKRGGTEAAREAFVASVFRALELSLPIPLTESMGNVAAGRPMTMRFTSPDPKERTL